MQKKVLAWLVIGALLVIPVLYFFARVPDTAFRDGAMGNWFATMVGVLIGIPIGLEIDRRQRKAQEKVQAEKRAKADRERLELVLGRIELELLHNQEGAKKLQGALAQSSSARADLWEWAITIVDSFSFAAHKDLVASGLQRLLPQKLEDNLYGSYRELDDLLHRVKQAAAALRFFYGYSSGAEKRSNQQLNEIRDFSQDVASRLDSTVEMLKSERAGRNLA